MSEQNKNEISLIDIYFKLTEVIAFLWSKKTILILVGVLGGTLGLLYAYLKPIKHEARLTFFVEVKGKGGLGGLSSLASSFGLGGLGGSGGLYENEINLINYLKSRSTLEEVLLTEVSNTKETFAQRFVDKYEWSKNWDEDSLLSQVHFNLNYPRAKFSRQQDSILNEIQLNFIENNLITIKKIDDEGTIIALTVSTEDDTISKFLPERLLSYVSTKYINTKTKLAKEHVDVLQRQTDSVRTHLNSSLYSAASETDQIFGLNPALNIKRVPVTKEQIDIQSSTILLGELIKNLELAKMSLKDQTPIIEIIDKPIFPLKIDKYSKKKAIIIGGFLTGFLAVGFLLLMRFISKIKTLSEQEQII